MRISLSDRSTSKHEEYHLGFQHVPIEWEADGALFRIPIPPLSEDPSMEKRFHEMVNAISLAVLPLPNKLRPTHATICRLYPAPPKGFQGAYSPTWKFEAIALCSEKDRFQRSTGRKLALTRLMTKLGWTKHERTQVWNQYHNSLEFSKFVNEKRKVRKEMGLSQ